MKKHNIKMQFDESAFKNLKDTVGRFPAETGGILLGSTKDFIVREFIFDPNGKTSSSAYDPDIDFLNNELKKARKIGLELLGFAHSHPIGVTRLSGDQGNGIGDLGYIKKILDAFPKLDRFLVPIIFSSHDGEFDIFPYVAFRSDIENYVMADLEIIKPNLTCVNNTLEFALPSEKLNGSVNYELMQNSHVVCVGVGGANGICENLVRTGLGKLTVIDFDTVSETNLTTQGFFISDIGKPKVGALENRLLNINPNLKFTGIQQDFTKLSKKEIESIVKGADLLLMMTDDFFAQAFGNRVALKYKIPAVFAIMYEKARACEISFSIPGITRGCHRCATSSRYEAYKEGYSNDVTSTGSTIFHTYYLNSAIGLISLAILHRSTEGYEFSNWFGDSWERNLIQLRLHPSFGQEAGNLFQKTFDGQERVVGLDSLWQKVEEESFPTYSEPCPDCGGIGDLNLSAYFISLLQNPLFRKNDWLTTDNI
jgi:proteasome lid subunit RPN8/RPN11